MIKINISPTAQADLQKIKRYIKEDLDNPQAANRLVGKIMKAVRKLSQFPSMGSPLRSILNIETEYRFLVCDNYLVFYRYKNEQIYVIHILHGQMDFVKILFQDITFE